MTTRYRSVTAVIAMAVAIVTASPALSDFIEAHPVPTEHYGIPPTSAGSGAIIGPHRVLTANHVIDGCRRVTANGMDAQVIARDAATDLAVLNVTPGGQIIPFHHGPVRIGEDVIVAGFPLEGELASSLNMTTGIISAEAGFKNNPNDYTISAPVNPGNSGGPLLDRGGNLVGIVVATATNAQNANFAVKLDVITEFLTSHGIDYDRGSDATRMTTADIGEQAKKFTAKIYCYEDTETARPSRPAPPATSSGGGYWKATASDDSCMLTSDFNDGRGLGLAVTRDLVFVLISKPSWSVPNGARVAARVQVDNYYPPLAGPGVAFPGIPNTIAIPVQPQYQATLAYYMIEGWWATVSFSGNEPPWRVSLWGVSASWPAFLQCARRVNPAFVSHLYRNATQPW